MRWVRSARRLPMALMCSTSMVWLQLGSIRGGRDSDRKPQQPGDVLGPVVVQHVAGRADDVPLASRDDASRSWNSALV